MQSRMLIIVVVLTSLTNCQNQKTIDYYNAAIELEDNDKYEEAILQLNKAIIQNPKFEKAYLNRAINKSIIGEYESAISDLNTVIYLNAKAIEPYVLRAEYKRMLEQYDSAMLDVEKALELKNPEYRGNDIVGPKEFNVNKLYPAGINFNIELEFIVFERAAANYHLGNYEQALRDIEFCEQPETDPINTHYYKGLVLLELNRNEEACDELRKAYNAGEENAKYEVDKNCEYIKYDR